MKFGLGFVHTPLITGGGDSFTFEDLIGVSHPDQILALSFSGIDPATHKIINEAAVEVPFQIVDDDDNVLVRMTGGMSASTTKSWTVSLGASSAASQVSVTDPGGTYLLIDNGIIAVRVSKATASFGNPTASGAYISFTGTLPLMPAPIQGIKHKNGTWTATGPNYLKYYGYVTDDGVNSSYNAINNYPATAMVVTIVENGPLRAVVEVLYTGPRSAWSYGALASWAGGTGSFKSTIVVDAGQSVVMVTDETDQQVELKYDMNTGVSADRCRYRGFGGASDVVYGHLANGAIYPMGHEGGTTTDAEFVLGTGVKYPAYNGATSTSYPLLYVWNTWEPNGGWYYQCFNNAAASTANIWGMFQGPASEYDTGSGGSSISIVGLYSDNTVSAHGIWLGHYYLSSSNQIQMTRTYPYGIFLGTKSADLPAAFTTNPGIGKAMNIHSGSAQLRKQVDWGLEFNTVGAWESLYLNYADISAKITAIRTDPLGSSGAGPYGRAWNYDPVFRDLWSAFRDATNATAAALVDSLLVEMRGAVDYYVNTYSIHYHPWSYWLGGVRFFAIAVKVDALFVLDRLSPFLTADQFDNLRATISLAGHILWDDDFSPLGNSGSFTLGNANMPIQQASNKYLFAILLRDHPQFQARLATVVDLLKTSFTDTVNAYGAPESSPHYSVTLTTTLDAFRQLQLAGIHDAFASGSDVKARLEAFAEFLMQKLSPKQARFGNRRKSLTFGDSPSDGHDTFLALITGFEVHNATLSKRMMDMWDDQGRPFISFYGSSLLKIDETLPMQDAALGDADFPGYMTVIRSAWNTANESAAFLVHGTYYVDHANCERGAVALYLLGAPTSIPFGSQYNPYIYGPYSTSLYIPVSVISGTWNTITDINQSCGAFSSAYLYSDTYVYTPTANRVDLTCTFSIVGWVRQLTYYRDSTSMPVVRLRDDNSDSGDSVFSLPMMATGAVTKPDNSTITPTTFNGTTFAISNGARFKFVGQSGISWDVYYFGPSANAFIGTYQHTFAPTFELNEYQAAVGSSFVEKQYFLRIKTNGPCDVVVVPYATASRPSDLNVVQISGGLRLTANSATRDLLN